MERILIILSLFCLVSNIYSIDEGIMDLEGIYNEIVSHKHLWEDKLNEWDFPLNYEDILKMERREISGDVIYFYRNVAFFAGFNQDEYRFTATLYNLLFEVKLKYVNGEFIYQNYLFGLW